MTALPFWVSCVIFYHAVSSGSLIDNIPHPVYYYLSEVIQLHEIMLLLSEANEVQKRPFITGIF